MSTNPGATKPAAACGQGLSSGGARALTVHEALSAVESETRHGFTIYDAKLNARWWPYQELVREVRRRGRRLRAQGLVRGARLCLLLPEYDEFILTFFGAISAGIVPVPLAPPLSGQKQGLQAALASIVRASRADALITTHSLVELAHDVIASAASSTQLLSLQTFESGESCSAEESPLSAEPDELCFLQFTSGSTALPKGVCVSHANLAANCQAISEEHMKIDRDKDLGLAWLPLYHDMGLIGFVCTPLFARMSCVLYPTASFVWNPSSWMELVHRHRATITFAPNFAYRLAALRQKRVEELDLSCVRIAGCGAEPVHPETMRAFCDRFAPAGLHPEALTPAYGLAEHTLAVAFERTDEPMRTLHIDREAYLTGHVRTTDAGAQAAGMEVVSCGLPAAGHEVAIVGADGKTQLGERRVGEIVLRGPSASRGYFEDEPASQALIVEGWLRTGDLGFLVDGRLYVSGRRKDLIIVSGKNYYPQEIEWSVAQLSSVRSGSVAAFGIDVEGTEKIVVVAETTSRDLVDLRARVEAQVAETVGLSPYDVLLVPPNTVPRTSSGKVQRSRARALYLQGGVRAFVPQPARSASTSDTSV